MSAKMRSVFSSANWSATASRWATSWVHKVKLHWFRYKSTVVKQLLFQVVGMVLDTGAEVGYYRARGRTAIGLDLTVPQFVEIDAAYRIYRVALNKDINLLCRAFVQRNNIFPSHSETGPGVEARERLSNEELLRLFAMEGGVSTPAVRPMLKSGNVST